MKKLFFILAIDLLAVPAISQECHEGVAWTGDPLAQSYKVYHDADGVDGGDVLKGTVTAPVSLFTWIASGACPPADRVYIVSVFPGGVEVTSDKVPFTPVVKAVIQGYAVKNQQ